MKQSEMKRGAYKVVTYDGTFEKWYANYGSARRRCSRLIAENKMCGIYQWSDTENKMACIIGC